MVRLWIVLFIMLGALRSPASANEMCANQLTRLVNDWQAIAVPGPHPTEAANSASSGHPHSASEVWYMRSQIRLALQLCNENKEHEAMLRMDVVRAWLKLPEVQHPANHKYSFDEEKRP